METNRDAELALKVTKLGADVAQLELAVAALTARVGALLLEIQRIRRDRVS